MSKTIRNCSYFPGSINNLSLEIEKGASDIIEKSAGNLATFVIVNILYKFLYRNLHRFYRYKSFGGLRLASRKLNCMNKNQLKSLRKLEIFC